MKKLFLSLLLGFWMCGCTMVTLLYEGAEGVKIVLKEPQGCELLDEVDGYAYNTWDDLSLKSIKTSARNDLKNNAYEMGADTVWLISRDKVDGSATAFFSGMAFSESQAKEYHIEGVAYVCEK